MTTERDLDVFLRAIKAVRLLTYIRKHDAELWTRIMQWSRYMAKAEKRSAA